jgi:hypothetical protein
VTRPKHEKLIEKMTDAFWSGDNCHRSITDPSRMAQVVFTITTLFREQPRSEDDMGALSWAADFLEKRLQEDAEQ